MVVYQKVNMTKFTWMDVSYIVSQLDIDPFQDPSDVNDYIYNVVPRSYKLVYKPH